jgi:hypothetical protein
MQARHLRFRGGLSKVLGLPARLLLVGLERIELHLMRGRHCVKGAKRDVFLCVRCLRARNVFSCSIWVLFKVRGGLLLFGGRRELHPVPTRHIVERNWRDVFVGLHPLRARHLCSG